MLLSYWFNRLIFIFFPYFGYKVFFHWTVTNWCSEETQPHENPEVSNQQTRALIWPWKAENTWKWEGWWWWFWGVCEGVVGWLERMVGWREGENTLDSHVDLHSLTVMNLKSTLTKVSMVYTLFNIIRNPREVEKVSLLYLTEVSQDRKDKK